MSHESDGVVDRMRAALDASGKSQTEMATALKVTQPTISQWLKGSRVPDRAALQRFAAEAGVDPEFLLFGRGRGPEPDLAAERADYVAHLGWRFTPEPEDGRRVFGNPSQFAFKPTIDYFIREVGQNIGDAAVEPTASLRLSIIRLTGADLTHWLNTIGWDVLRTHVEASIVSGGQIGEALNEGVRMVDSGELILLRISDDGTCGLNGPEVGRGNFAALCRNLLDSSKPSGTSGGTYGLGKAVLGRMSALNTVLFCSNLTEPVDGQSQLRFFGRADLVWHECDGGAAFDGPGWLGTSDPDHPQRTVSLWGNRALAKDLLMERGSRPGTTITVVGFQDPSADEPPTPDELAERLEVAVAHHFWPALATDRLEATVEIFEGRSTKSRKKVDIDVSTLQPAFAELLAKHESDDVVDKLTEAGEVVRVPVELRVPQRFSEPAHPAFTHAAVLLVRRAAPDDTSSTVGSAPMFRGSGMVVKTLDLRQVAIGVSPFHAAVLCGNAAGGDPDDERAEMFLRAAEPPAHNTWEVTEKLNQEYGRGGGVALRQFESAIRQGVRDVLLPTVEEKPDGPRDLADLFRLVEPPPPPQRAPRLVVESAELVDGAWVIDATVRRKDVGSVLRGRPRLVFNSETGGGTPVRWAEIKKIKNCEIDKDLRVVIPADARAARFTARTDPASHPVAATHASVSVDFRQVEVEGDS